MTDQGQLGTKPDRAGDMTGHGEALNNYWAEIAPTGKLRWLQVGKTRVLQQEWQIVRMTATGRRTDYVSTEWRDIPTITPGDEG